MTTSAPVVDGRVVGLAHYAARAVLERVLSAHDVTFQQFITLRLAAAADGPVELDALVDGVTGAVKVDASDVYVTVDELIAVGLLAEEEPSRVRITDVGRELYTKGSAETAAAAARIYAGISEEDRAVAGRVLTLVTERADAELAALSEQPATPSK
ncbi:MarR family winged helix-turn-helix transcriptional regulator [Streptomyces sp. HUAS TT20]|uniref:MarR family winged helix-turn-helix transcriptional regulator n=1 Tax=Streptomyces sp. HUAS TT20 TaxID=3447509 RepID=UPI0021DB4190|nr:MarR family winged helix-turn-helix transcriptional regulator [Streptomyces sp. HUAS 15-9]UXY31383.1 MarR family winged helix-turn-helix transcriptional regulator [Streptomyces sp. HUAS 15-9]